MRLFLVLIFSFAANHTFSQKINIEDIVNYLKSGNIAKAKETAVLAMNDSYLSQNHKTWFYSAITYHSIYESEDKNVTVLDQVPLFKAYEFYLKTLQLDTKKEFTPEVIKALRIVSSQFVYEGIQYFNSGSYSRALESFENTININKLPEINVIDTIIIYNAALAAEKSGKTEVSAGYYNELIKLKFGGPKIYLDLALVYKKEGKITEYINTLNAGLKCPPVDDIDIISEFANHYLEMGNNELTLKYIEMGLIKEPGNPAYHFVKASIFEQQGDLPNAEKEYLKTIEIDPGYTDALYNLGILYYNNATDLIKQATNKDQQNKAYELYSKAEPLLEKLYSKSPEDEQIVKMLRTIYTLLQKEDKLKRLDNE